MRPPQNAGEDFREGSDEPDSNTGFNEAPAERGGRPGRLLLELAAQVELQ